MTVKTAIEQLMLLNPEHELCVQLELDEDLKPGETKTFLNVTGFKKASEDTVTYMDSQELVEKNGNVVAVIF